jgi:hypothetical protein
MVGRSVDSAWQYLWRSVSAKEQKIALTVGHPAGARRETSWFKRSFVCSSSYVDCMR